MGNLNTPQMIYIVITCIIAIMFAGVLWMTLARGSKKHYDAEGQRIIDDEDDMGASGGPTDRGAES